MRRHDLLRIVSIIFALTLLSTSLFPLIAAEQVKSNPVWIWHNGAVKGHIAAETCLFRKTVQIPKDATAFLEIASQGKFELHFNGTRIGVGENSATMVRFDLTKHLRLGENVLAVRVDNPDPGDAGLAAILTLSPQGGRPITMVTDATWKSAKRALPIWNRTFYNDSRWLAAQTLDHFYSNARSPQIARDASNSKSETSSTPLARPTDSHPRIPATNDLTGQSAANQTVPLNSPVSIPTTSPSSANQQSANQRIATDSTSGTNVAAAHVETLGGSSQTADNRAPQNAAARNLERPINVDHLAAPDFRVPKGFVVQHVASNRDVDSLIAMTFNEFGQIVASRENGNLEVIIDRDGDGNFDTIRNGNASVKNVQGIVALNGSLFVVGNGPSGNGVYHLQDLNLDGFFENERLLFNFKGEPGEHGAHGIAFGPDGMLYVVVGNHTSASVEYDGNSPYRNPYEGDLAPRFEDPSGHANNVKAPGGSIIRINLEGTKVERLAGGLRNAYDMAFDAHGNLFTHDSDMEFDAGTTWFRPTRVLNVTAGAEFGWRSGWAKWPEYFYDSLPSIADTGRGSPTGMIVYDHTAFPQRYRGTLFSGDWLNGQILVMKLNEDGAGFTAKPTPFIKGKPLNVTDLDVGPDGALYFTTGGRGTAGNIYRIVWNGAPNANTTLKTGIDAVLKQPQFQSAWARQQIATLQAEMGATWMGHLIMAARDRNRNADERVRALDIMRLFGPATSTDILIELSRDTDAKVRAKAARLLVFSPNVAVRQRLNEMLGDPSSSVRKSVCESLLQAGHQVDISQFTTSLASKDRFESTAARRLLEFMPLNAWRTSVLTSENPRIYLQGGLAMMVADPTPANAQAVLQRGIQLTEDFLNDRDFVDLLRLFQVALHRSGISNAQTGNLAEILEPEYPSTDETINRELVRLLTHLQVASIMDRYFAELEREDLSAEDHLHLATHLTFLTNGWTQDTKFKLFKHLEAKPDAGNAVPGYLQNISIRYSKNLTPEEVKYATQNGDRWPSAALAAVMQFPAQLDDDQLQQLTMLDERLATSDNESTRRLKIAIVALLARDGSPKASAYLRGLLDQNDARRKEIAYGLAENVERANVPYIVRNLELLDLSAQREMMKQLQSQSFNPNDAVSYRAIFACAERLNNNGADEAITVLERWQGFQPSRGKIHWSKAMIAWKNWYATKFPNEPLQTTTPVQSPSSPTDQPAVPTVIASNESAVENHASTVADIKPRNGKWEYEPLLKHINQSLQSGAASVQRGQQVYIKAECNKCHRHNNTGESMGPMLTNISQRFRTSEILESILFPSKVISDQYVAKQVLMADGKSYTGIVAAGPFGQVSILQTNGRKVRVSEDDIEETKVSKVSAMPDGALDALTLQEIADLFALLTDSQTVQLSTTPANTKTR